MATVGIIIPVFNIEKYICKCIDSILEQSYKDFEVILVDDGSTDDSGKICDHYCTIDKRIHVIHKPNGGLSSARNSGLNYIFEKIFFKYITFIDGDDYVDNNYLKVLVEHISNYDVVICQYYEVDMDNNLFAHPCFNDILSVNESHSFFDICTKDVGIFLSIATCKLIKKELLCDIRFKENVIHEDEYFSNDLYKRKFRFLMINEKLYFYFQRSSSLNSVKNVKEQYDLFGAFIERCSVCRSFNKRSSEYYYYRFCCEIFGNILGYKDFSRRTIKNMARKLFIESLRMHNFKQAFKFLVLSFCALNH